MKKMNRKLAAVAMTATMLGGMGAGAVLGSPSIAGADTATSTSTTDTAKSPSAWLDDALKKLVTDGTINQSQSDAVNKALQAAQPARGDHGGRGGGMRFDVVVKAIGIDEATLKSELTGDTTIADVAKAHNVDAQKVIDAVVADQDAKLAEQVTAGKITQDQADKMKANATQRATDMVNRKASDRPARPERGAGGPADAAPPAADGSATPATAGAAA